MSIMDKLLEFNDELVKVRAERDDLIETVRLKDEQIEMLSKELMQAYDERVEAWKERDQTIGRERCLLNELTTKQRMWDAHYDQLSTIQEKLNGELVEARKLIDRLEKGLHQARCHIQNMATHYQKGD